MPPTRQSADSLVPMSNCKRAKLIPQQKVNLASFALGTRVPKKDKGIDGYFCNHFDSARSQIRGINASFLHGRNKLTVTFNIFCNANDSPKGKSCYQLRTNYEAFKAITWYTGNFGEQYMFIQLQDPMLLFRRERGSKGDSDSWNRVTKIIEFNQKTNFGMCNVLRLEFDPVGKRNGSGDGRRRSLDPTMFELLETLKLFMDQQSPIPFEQKYLQNQDAKPDSSFSWNFISDMDFMNEARLQMTCVGRRILRDCPDIPYEIQYALHCIFNYSYQFEDELGQVNNAYHHFWSGVENICKNKKPCEIKALESALYELYYILERSDPLLLLESFVEKFKEFRKKYMQDENYDQIGNKLAKGVKLIRRGVLTPTRLILMPPFPFLESRFFRNCESNRAIRIAIRDDNCQQLSFTTCMSGSTAKQQQFLIDVVLRPLRCGLYVGKERFDYLGSSSSQLRDHGIVVYAVDSEQRSAKMMRQAIGDLAHIRSVPKYMARVGLAFSQSMGYIEIEDDDMQVIPDIKRGSHPMTGEPYNFTDGVGRISVSLARRICEKMRIPEPIPSAYQIRYKGAKGLVVISDQVPDGKIQLRDSMIKFISDSKTLEILKYSKNRQVYLNRPLIALLHDLQVGQEFICEMLFKELRGLTMVFLDDQQAAMLIRTQSPLLNAIVPVKELINANVSILNEPFFRRALDALVQRGVRDLKEKARISVDRDKGRTVFGCIDEYDCLKEEEIFLQVSHEDGKPNEIITGCVMVTKYPCMHPGDVRKVRAVNRKDLHHIVDCIVFPAKGERPLTDQMAGSDLDGDEYSVFWDSKLFFPNENYEPMDFPSNTAEELNREITEDDMLRFLTKYIQSSNVGLIANTHLATADFYNVFKPECLTLCEKYAISLDFVKSGKVEHLAANERACMYPDFMMKTHEKPTYCSKKTLGMLYRHISQFELSLSDDAMFETSSSSEQFLYEGWERYKEVAQANFEDYARDIEGIMRRFNIEDESCMMANVLTTSSKHLSSRKDASDIQDIVEFVVTDLFEKHRKVFLGDMSPLESCSSSDQLAKASAYYFVGKAASDQRLRTESTPIFSFPWLVTTELSKIAHLNQGARNESKSRFEHAIIALDRECRTQLEYSDAELIMINWLKKQHHFKDSRFQPKLETIVRRMVQESKRIFAVNNVNETTACIVVKSLELVIEQFYKPVKMSPCKADLNKIGLEAITTLSKFFRSLDPKHILNDDHRLKKPERMLIRSFHIVIFLKSFQDLAENERPWFEGYLKRMSDVSEISSIYCTDSKLNYLLVCARGTSWQLLNLERLVHTRTFFRDTLQVFEQEKQRYGR